MKCLTFLTTKGILLLSGTLLLTGCTTAGNALNPFYETPGPTAFLGQPNDHALNSSANKELKAREAMERMASYERASLPSPYKPVVQPAVIRLMWVPDHLNTNGDLVPAHYYYLKVKSEQFNVTDVHDKQRLLGGTSSSTALPYVSDGEAKDIR